MIIIEMKMFSMYFDNYYITELRCSLAFMAPN